VRPNGPGTCSWCWTARSSRSIGWPPIGLTTPANTKARHEHPGHRRPRWYAGVDCRLAFGVAARPEGGPDLRHHPPFGGRRTDHPCRQSLHRRRSARSDAVHLVEFGHRHRNIPWQRLFVAVDEEDGGKVPQYLDRQVDDQQAAEPCRRDRRENKEPRIQVAGPGDHLDVALSRHLTTAEQETIVDCGECERACSPRTDKARGNARPRWPCRSIRSFN
jgi:hypothetical protein